MKRLAAIGLAVVLAMSGLPAAFAQTADTVHRDLQRLQDDIVNLEDSLAALEPPHPREAEMRARAERIRERVERLASDARSQGGAVRTVSSEEIRSLRRDVTALQRDVDSAVGGRTISGSNVTLPEGTELQVRLEESLTSATARPEDRFEATVAVPVRDEAGRVVIPAGTRVRGIVKAAESGQRPARAGRLDLTFDTIYLDERTATPCARAWSRCARAWTSRARARASASPSAGCWAPSWAAPRAPSSAPCWAARVPWWPRPAKT